MTLLVSLDESKAPRSVPSFVKRVESSSMAMATTTTPSNDGGNDTGEGRGPLKSVVAALLKARRIAVVCGESRNRSSLFFLSFQYILVHDL